MAGVVRYLVAERIFLITACFLLLLLKILSVAFFVLLIRLFAFLIINLCGNQKAKCTKTKCEIVLGS